MLRIGRISFIHNDLAFHYLEKKTPSYVELVSAPPQELLKLLLTREIDLAPISSASILANNEELMVVPAMSVHSRGPALSAGVVSRERRPIRCGDTIAVTRYTETALKMFELTLKAKNMKVNLIKEGSTSAEELLTKASFALLIGDEALRTWVSGPSMVFDIGGEWWKFTGRTAVFAVSAIHRSLIREDKEKIDQAVSLVKRSVEYGYMNLGEVIRKTFERTDIPPDLLTKYFRSLKLDYNTDVEAGFDNLLGMLK